MPTYAYACSSCSHAFDIYQSFSDDALTVCPSCNEPTLRKQFSAVGVVFKGSGFYRNDSRSGSEKSGSAKSNSSSSGSSGSSDSGSSGSSSSGSSSEKSSSSSTPSKAASTSS
nr:FmdB family zinc ribbon protein [Ruania rhizosphaerae]